MRLFWILAFFWGCAAPKPQFHYGQLVRVTDGFYKGCVGSIIQVSFVALDKDIYEVDLKYCDSEFSPNGTSLIVESDLQAIVVND